jgi:hypothetical protein
MSKTEDDFEFGTPAYMLARTTDPETSHIAAKANDSDVGEESVFLAIKSFGETGCISADVLKMFPPSTAYSSVTGRWAPLLRKFFIERTGERRIGDHDLPQCVMRALSEEERARRLALFNALLEYELTADEHVLVEKWYISELALQAAIDAEAALRSAVIDRVFNAVPEYGLATVHLGLGWRLRCKKSGEFGADRLELLQPKAPK